MKGVRLVGSDHRDLGQISSQPVGPRAAVALSRGRHPKGYPSVDPNEDAVLIHTDGERWLMAVADGHWGIDAAEAAVDALASRSTELLAMDPEVAPEAALRLAAEAVAAIGKRQASTERSRTSLSVAVVGRGAVYHAGVGDSTLFLVGRTLVRRIAAAGPFLGSTQSLRPQTGKHVLHRGVMVLLATDGLTDFLGPGWRRRLRRARAETPTNTARALVQAAFAGGAGDNIAIAVCQPRG